MGSELNREVQITIRDLESDVTREEIKRAVWDCGIDKSPGLDGFTFGFYSGLLHVIEKALWRRKETAYMIFRSTLEKEPTDSVMGFLGRSMFKGISLGSSLQLSHLFYADDAVFVGQWNNSNIDNIVHVLQCFHQASGLRINMSKSKLMGVYVNDDLVEQAALKIGCHGVLLF
ncbi:hypothetical protein Tco_0152117 [Tanacetum coccineum]